MELFEAIRGRRSIRSYRPDGVSERDIEKILEAAVLAPSAGNLQSWEFVIVTEHITKMALAEAAHGQDFITEAPVVIVVCANKGRSAKRYRERGANLYSIQDTAAATQNILLAAYALGYGTCWIGAFDETRAAQIIRAPPEIRPVAIVPIGVPAESPNPPPRIDLNKVVHYERFK